MQLPTLFAGRPVGMIEMTARNRGGVVHASTVVMAPAFGGAGDRPDAALPDQVLDAELLGVSLEPVDDRPPLLQRWAGGAGADAVAEHAVAGTAERVLGIGRRPRR